MSTLLTRLGHRVRSARLARGQTLRDLAATSGLSVRFIGQLESGQGNISIARLSELCAALELPLEALLGEPERSLVAAEPQATYPAPAALDPHRARLQRLVARLSDLDVVTLARVEAALDATLGDPVPGVVALLGVRGAGKSTVGRRVARVLGFPFVELDQRIEEVAGLSLAEIFAIHGEPHYRQLERDVLEAFLDEGRPAVLATGGSLVTHRDAWRLLRAGALTVWLRADARDHWERVIAQGDDRPMRRNPQAYSQLEAMLAAREPLYGQAHARVETTGRSVDTVVEEVVSLVRRAREAGRRGPGVQG